MAFDALRTSETYWKLTCVSWIARLASPATLEATASPSAIGGGGKEQRRLHSSFNKPRQQRERVRSGDTRGCPFAKARSSCDPKGVLKVLVSLRMLPRKKWGCYGETYGRLGTIQIFLKIKITKPTRQLHACEVTP